MGCARTRPTTDSRKVSNTAPPGMSTRPETASSGRVDMPGGAVLETLRESVVGRVRAQPIFERDDRGGLVDDEQLDARQARKLADHVQADLVRHDRVVGC